MSKQFRDYEQERFRTGPRGVTVGRVGTRTYHVPPQDLNLIPKTGVMPGYSTTTAAMQGWVSTANSVLQPRIMDYTTPTMISGRNMFRIVLTFLQPEAHS